MADSYLYISDEKKRAQLSQELQELFEVKTAKQKYEKELSAEASESQKDIQLLSVMFMDGIPNVELQISKTESIMWDEKAQKLLYVENGNPQIIESTSREIIVKIRPFLIELVKKAKSLYH